MQTSVSSLHIASGGSVHWHEPPLLALVFTDLDGTLLDDSYDLPEAARVMDHLSERGALVVPTSSKTLREMRELDALRSRPQPFVFENGAGIGWPRDRIPDHVSRFSGDHGIELVGPRYEAICALLDELKRDRGYGFLGFSGMTARDVAKHTGLTPEAAALAKDRMATEPLIWCDGEAAFAQFNADLAERGLIAVSGGRFVHVMPATDKGTAARTIAAACQKQRSRVPIIACGDSANDAPLLAMADACVTFPNRLGEHLPTRHQVIRQADAAGPQQWLLHVSDLVSELTAAANDSKDTTHE